MPAEVESDDVEASGEPFGELREMAAVARDPVQAGDDRRAALAPFVAVQGHEPAGASGADASSVRRVSASLTSDQTTTPCLSIRKVPRIAAPGRLVEDAVGPRRGAVRPEVRGERVAQPELPLPGLARRSRVARDEHHLRLGLLERAAILLQVARLVLADRGERERDGRRAGGCGGRGSRQASRAPSRRPPGRSQAPRCRSRSRSSPSSTSPAGRTSPSPPGR